MIASRREAPYNADFQGEKAETVEQKDQGSYNREDCGGEGAHE